MLVATEALSSSVQLPQGRSGWLEIPVDHGISPYMCEMCKNRIVHLEAALVDLAAFKELCQESRKALMRVSGPTKRPKATSGDIGVSPDTAKQRPSSKRSRKKLEFPCKCLVDNHATIIRTMICQLLQGHLELRRSQLEQGRGQHHH